MKKLSKYFVFFTLLLFSAAGLPALDMVDIWRHSEIAGVNSVFVDIGIAPFMLGSDEFDLKILPLDVRIEYLPPFVLPVSLGLFLNTPYPNLKHFGARAAYHFDLLDPVTDFYIVYSFDFGFLRNGLLEKYDDTAVEIHYYDFRAGVRYFFRPRLGLLVETGFKFESITFSVSVKIN